MSNFFNDLELLLRRAREAGAHKAEAMVSADRTLTCGARQGKLETLNQAESLTYGLRVLVGRRQAVLSTNDVNQLTSLGQKAVDMARVVPENPYADLPDPALYARETLDLDQEDLAVYTPVDLEKRALEAEGAALAVPGVTNSEGARTSWGRSKIDMMTSEGFQGSHAQTYSSLYLSAVAGEGEAMEREGEYTQAIHGKDMTNPRDLGRKAGEEAVKRLNPRSVKTGSYPVVFHRHVASRYLLSPFLGAISGPSIARGVSFLRDSLHRDVFSSSITLVDDPLMKRGLGSQPFDGEGVACHPREIVSEGRLNTWLLNVRSAAQLGLQTTGHATHGVGGLPGVGPTNFYMAQGEGSFEDMLADIQEGFYVTSLMGFGINGTTGDLSLGASGFWIEKGRVAYPVSGLTIAGNLKEMFKCARAADDLIFEGSINAPTVHVGSMMVAGQS